MQILLDDEVGPVVAGLLGGVSISSCPCGIGTCASMNPIMLSPIASEPCVICPRTRWAINIWSSTAATTSNCPATTFIYRPTTSTMT